MLGWLLLLIVLCRQSIAPKTVMVRMLGGLCAQPVQASWEVATRLCVGLRVVGCEGRADMQRCTADQGTAKHQNRCLTNVIVCTLSTPISHQRC